MKGFEDQSEGKKRRGRPRLPQVTRDAIYALASSGLGPADIERALADLCDQQRIPRVPDPKTIRFYAQQVAPPPDPSGAWSFSDATPQEAGPVLDALAAILNDSAGRIRTVTRREAKLISRIAKARPEIPPADQWRIARQYVAREVDKEPTADLDALLAVAPWRADANRELYYKLRRDNHIPEARGLMVNAIAESEASRDTHLLRRLAYPESELDMQLRRAMLRRQGDPTDPEEWDRQYDAHIKELREKRQEPDGVSNPVSDDARSATGRSRPKRPQQSGAQDMADGDE